MKHEIPHNTPEQVRGYLTDALNLVAELDPPSDLRGITLSKAVDLISAKQIVMEQVQMQPPLLDVLRGV